MKTWMVRNFWDTLYMKQSNTDSIYMGHTSLLLVHELIPQIGFRKNEEVGNFLLTIKSKFSLVNIENILFLGKYWSTLK